MITDDILVKYLVGEVEPHEATMVEQWRKASTENEKRLRQFAILWEKSATVKDHHKDVNIDVAWQNVQQKINAAANKKVSVFILNTKWLKAASLALLLGIGLFLFNRNFSVKEEILTANASSQNLQLEDGSKVMVRNGSFSYPKTFKGDKRKVTLNKGKAFFEIASNKQKPFEIEAHNTLITVVGTAFEIITSNEFTQVLVKEGKVKFSTPSGEKILTAGMGARYNEKNRLLENIHSESNNTFGYTSGRLNFNNQTLKLVISDLNAFYEDYTIELDNKNLENCRITSSFDHDKLETVLRVISLTLNLQAEHLPNSKIILIKGKGCIE